MFGLFKSKPSGIKVIDKVWMSRAAMTAACVKMLDANPDCLFITWFDETFDALDGTLNGIGKFSLVKAATVTSEMAANKMVLFIEHYPLTSVEQALFEKLNLPEVPVLSSLDNDFFQKFGGEKLIELMHKMGMKEDEIVGHAMVTKSIRRAQDKIAASIHTDTKAKSLREWFAINR